MPKKATETKQPSVLGENTKVTLTIAWDKIHSEYEALLSRQAASVTIPGFRKGKAPKAMAEAALGREKLVEHALRHVLPEIYEAEIKQQGILPLVAPQVTIISADEGKDWVVEAQTAVAPTIDLKKYQETIKKAAADHKAKADKEAKAKDSKEKKDQEVEVKKDETKAKDELLQSIYVALIEDIQPKIAPLLLQEEMERQAQQVVSQISRMGMDLTTYLEKVGKSEEDFNQELAAVSLGALQLEFIMRAIANEMKLEVTDADIQASFPELQSLKSKPIPPELKPQLEAAALRQKTTTAILALVK